MWLLAAVWAVTATFCGAGLVLGAEKAPQKPVEKHAPAQPSAKAPPPKPAPEKTASPAVDDIPKNTESGDIDENAKDEAKGTSLPIPRFVSLRTNPINLRTGPGVRYPVDWVYLRRHLPVEVIGEFDTWRRIRDPAGAEGWVHQSMLSGKRTAIVTGGARALKRTADETAETLATLEAGVVLNVLRCPADTTICRVEVNGLQGWLPRDQFWGVYPSEVVQ